MTVATQAVFEIITSLVDSPNKYTLLQLDSTACENGEPISSIHDGEAQSLAGELSEVSVVEVMLLFPDEF